MRLNVIYGKVKHNAVAREPDHMGLCLLPGNVCSIVWLHVLQHSLPPLPKVMSPLASSAGWWTVADFPWLPLPPEMASSRELAVAPTILDKTVDTNPLSPGQCWFGVACWAHCHLNFSVEYGKRLLQHCSGARGATDTLFHNKGDLFRKCGGKVPFLSMCQQVLSKIVSQSFSIFSWSTDPNGTNS